MEKIVWALIANIIRMRMKALRDMELAEGKSAYLDGRKDGTYAVLEDVANYLESEGIVACRQFIDQCIREEASKERELSTASCG